MPEPFVLNACQTGPFLVKMGEEVTIHREVSGAGDAQVIGTDIMAEGSGKILIVEDNNTLAQYLKEILLSFGYLTVGPVDTGRKAIAAALETNPDLILMDVNLPGGMDGIDAARQIKAQRDIPVIYLSAYSGSDILQRAKPTEPMSYLVKPFKTEELYSNIEMALYQHKMQKKLRASEARFAGILATASDAIIGVDAANKIRLFNGSAERMFGYKAVQIMGQSLDLLVHADKGSVDLKELRDLARSPDHRFQHAQELAGRRRNGQLFPVEASVSRYVEDDGALFIAVVRDVSERKRAEQELRHYAQRLEQTNTLLTALNQVAVRLQSTRDLDQVLATLGNELQRLDITCLLTLVEESEDRQRIYYTSLSPAVLAQVNRWLDINLIGLTVRTPAHLSPGTRPYVPVGLDDVLEVVPALERSAFASLARRLNLDAAASIFSLPLRVEERLLGSLIIWGGDLDEAKMPTFQIFASQVATALDNTRLLEAERRAREQAETLQEVASILNVSLNVEQILDLILRHVGRVIPYDSASMMLVKDDRLEIVARRGDRHLQGAELPTSLTIAQLPSVQKILDSRRPVFVADTRADPRWVDMGKGYEIRSWLGVPILSDAEIIGILNLDNNEAGFYTVEDARLAEAFAGQAKLAIENAHLFARTRLHAEELEYRVDERTRNLSALYEVAEAISRNMPLPQILERVLHSALRTLGGHVGMIHLQEEGREEPFIQVDLSGSPALPSQLLAQTPARNALSAVFVEGKAQIAHGTVAGKDAPYALAAVPMRIHGEVMGVLTLFRSSTTQFNVEDFALLVSLGEHAAVAVENTRLRRQAEQAAVAAERERLARDLHDSVTQQLYSLTLFAEAVREQGHNGAVSQEYVEAIGDTAQQALREMRLLLYGLRAGTFSHDGLVEALRFRLDAVEQRAGLETRLLADTAIHLPPPLEEGLYRIAQEALNNVLKHAGATAVLVYLRRHGSEVRLGIYDNGRGFEPAGNHSAGMGLSTMRERAAKLGVELQLQSASGRGTRVQVIVPLGDPAGGIPADLKREEGEKQ